MRDDGVVATPSIQKAVVHQSGFVQGIDQAGQLPYGLKKRDFQNAMEALYDFFYVVNSKLMENGLDWMERLVRPAAVSNMVSDMTAAAIAKHSNGLCLNKYHNGHPDLIPRNTYPGDSVEAGEEGVEVKSTKGRVADTHGARDGWFCQFNYRVDPEDIIARRHPTVVTHIYLAKVTVDLFRRNERKTDRGTHTSTLNADGMKVLRAGLIYKHPVS